jgi:hypothetical protein
MDYHFAWRGTYGTGLALVARLGPVNAVDALAFCMTNMKFGDVDVYSAWQI